jgi:hypothetical protein
MIAGVISISIVVGATQIGANLAIIFSSVALGFH